MRFNEFSSAANRQYQNPKNIVNEVVADDWLRVDDGIELQAWRGDLEHRLEALQKERLGWRVWEQYRKKLTDEQLTRLLQHYKWKLEQRLLRHKITR